MTSSVLNYVYMQTLKRIKKVSNRTSEIQQDHLDMNWTTYLIETFRFNEFLESITLFLSSSSFAHHLASLSVTHKPSASYEFVTYSRPSTLPRVHHLPPPPMSSWAHRSPDLELGYRGICKGTKGALSISSLQACIWRHLQRDKRCTSSVKLKGCYNVKTSFDGLYRTQVGRLPIQFYLQIYWRNLWL